MSIIYQTKSIRIWLERKTLDDDHNILKGYQKYEYSYILFVSHKRNTIELRLANGKPAYPSDLISLNLITAKQSDYISNKRYNYYGRMNNYCDPNTSKKSAAYKILIKSIPKTKLLSPLFYTVSPDTQYATLCDSTSDVALENTINRLTGDVLVYTQNRLDGIAAEVNDTIESIDSFAKICKLRLGKITEEINNHKLEIEKSIRKIEIKTERPEIIKIPDKIEPKQCPLDLD